MARKGLKLLAIINFLWLKQGNFRIFFMIFLNKRFEHCVLEITWKKYLLPYWPLLSSHFQILVEKIKFVLRKKVWKIVKVKNMIFPLKSMFITMWLQKFIPVKCIIFAVQVSEPQNSLLQVFSSPLTKYYYS